MNRAIFFDRDGTLLVEIGYVTHSSQVIPYHFTCEALRLARRSGFLLVAVTNQSGIARGYLSESDLLVIHQRMNEILREQNARLDAIYYCPHHTQATVDAYRKRCDCRKPGPGLGRIAAETFGIDIRKSYVIGDKETDLLFGRSLGATSCLVRTGFGSYEEQRIARSRIGGVQVFDNVLDAVRWATGQDKESRQ